MVRWIRQLFGPRPRRRPCRLASSQARARRRVVPQLDALEDRLVPSTTSAFPLTTATDTSVTQLYGINVTQNDLNRFAPVIDFHPNEQYYPASVDFLLQHSSLYQRVNQDPTLYPEDVPATLIKAGPLTQQDLATHPDKTSFLTIDAAAWHGNNGV